MTLRILSTSLFCGVLACVALPASAAMRPEIAWHLINAHWSPPIYAMKEISAAEAVPNQTAEEKNRVARARARLMRDQGASGNDLPSGGITVINDTPSLSAVYPTGNSGASNPH